MASREMAFLCFQQRKRVFLRLFGLCRCISTPHGCYLLACSLRTLICTKGTHHKKGKPHAKTAVNKSNEWFCVAHCTGQQTYINSTMFPTFLRANEHQLVQGLCAGLWMPHFITQESAGGVVLPCTELKHPEFYRNTSTVFTRVIVFC